MALSLKRYTRSRLGLSIWKSCARTLRMSPEHSLPIVTQPWPTFMTQFCTIRFCPTVFVTDALTIQDYYRERYGKQSVFIPYGAGIGKVESTEVLAALGLEVGRYFLYVSRLEPENHPLEVDRKSVV